MENKKINVWLLERYILDELPKEKTELIKNQLRENPELKREIERIKRSDQAILNQYPPDSFVPKISRRYQEEKSKKENIKRNKAIFSKRLLYASSVFVSALVLLIIVFYNHRDQMDSSKQTPSTPSTRIKGTQSMDLTKTHLILHRQINNGVELLEHGDRARVRDLLQIAYVAAEELYGVILSIDGNGIVTLHFPESKDESTLLEQHKNKLLGQSYELDDAPEFERFFFITSGSEIDVEEILTKAEALAKNPHRAKRRNIELPDIFNQSSMLLIKEEQP